MTFGNGSPWEAFSDPPIDEGQARMLARWFLVLIPRAEVGHEPPASDLEDPTGDIDTAARRSPTGSFVGVGSKNRVVYRVVRSPRAQFDFVSVGRNEGNDVVLPHSSVSRFHAFLRELPDGGVVVQDARSSNGTFARGARVARQGEGPPTVLRSGDPIRFGDIHGVILDAAGLAAFVRAPG